MAFVFKHWDVTGEQVGRLKQDPNSVTPEPSDEAVSTYLKLTPEQRGYPLGNYVVGRFVSNNKGPDTLHTGSIVDGSYESLARGRVVEDLEEPDGLYEVYVPI